MKKILDNLHKCEFDIDFDYGSDKVLVQKKRGPHLFEFVVRYDKILKNHRKSSYLNPEECDIIFLIEGISDVNVYGLKNNEIELTDKEIETITEIILNKIIH
ncbi:MAG TPA: hypothetical protein VJ945_06230 [Flavobacteriaceae bacterium]|nr:hypothetical protein [Flavobacteriaceae bacterium]